MKDYTAQFGHMEERPKLKIGQVLKYGDVVGIMGTSGQSKWPHLHLHVIEGLVSIISRLSDIFPRGKYTPNKKQLMYFFDSDLFGIKPVKTTRYNCQSYKKKFMKPHFALDLVPKDRKKTKKHFTIRWNRSKDGTVLAFGFDPNGYGYYAIIGFSA